MDIQSLNAETINSKVFSITNALIKHYEKIQDISYGNDDLLKNTLCRFGKYICDPTSDYSLEDLNNINKTLTEDLHYILAGYNAELIDTYKNNSDVIFELIKNGLILPKEWFNIINVCENECLLKNLDYFITLYTVNKNPILYLAKKKNAENAIKFLINTGMFFSYLVSHLPDYQVRINYIKVQWIINLNN